MKPGRKPLAIPRIRWTVYIRQDLAAETELLLLDPMREKVKYGSRTEYLEALIEKDLAERRLAHTDSPADNQVSTGRTVGEETKPSGPVQGDES